VFPERTRNPKTGFHVKASSEAGRVKALKLVGVLLIAGSLFAGKGHDWKTGKVTWAGLFPYTASSSDTSNPFSNGAIFLMAGSRPGILQRLQIEGNPYVFYVSYVVNWHTPKVAVDGPIQFALDPDGKFYIRDEDNREYKVTVLSKVISPPPVAFASNDLDWKTGRLNWTGYIPRYPSGMRRPQEATQWLQIEGNTYVYNLTYTATRNIVKVTVNRPVKYALEPSGEFHVLDEDNRDFKVEMASKAPLPSKPKRPSTLP